MVAVPCAMKPTQLLASLNEYKEPCKYESEFADRLVLPTVLDTACSWIPFGKLNKELFLTWKYMQEQTDINFDLTYAPSAWRQILHAWNSTPNNGASSMDNVIYLHCGGQESNLSQLRRYRRKWPDITDHK